MSAELCFSRQVFRLLLLCNDVPKRGGCCFSACATDAGVCFGDEDVHMHTLCSSGDSAQLAVHRYLLGGRHKWASEEMGGKQCSAMQHNAMQP